MAGRFSVEIKGKTGDIVERFVDRDGGTKSDVVRRAINVLDTLDRQVENGAEIIIVEKDGTPRKLLFA
jgi:hypothetical protein